MRIAFEEAAKELAELAEEAAKVLANILERSKMKEIDLEIILSPVKHHFPELIPIKANTLPLGRHKTIYHCRNNC